MRLAKSQLPFYLWTQSLLMTYNFDQVAKQMCFVKSLSQGQSYLAEF